MTIQELIETLQRLVVEDKAKGTDTIYAFDGSDYLTDLYPVTDVKLEGKKWMIETE